MLFRSVDIRALSLADTTDFGILRLIVDKEDAAEAALRGAGFTVSLTPVIAIGVSDRPGGLAEAMAALRDGGIIVEYMYAFISRRKDTAYVILRVDDNARAAVLGPGAGFAVLRDADIDGSGDCLGAGPWGGGGHGDRPPAALTHPKSPRNHFRWFRGLLWLQQANPKACP